MKLRQNIKKYLSEKLDDKAYIKLLYFIRLKRFVNLENPKRFTDKMQWLKLNWKHLDAHRYADKYEVRSIVEKKIGAQYLNELLGVYNHFEEIDFNLLPNKFVIKVTHGSGYNIICTCKTQFNKKAAKENIEEWMQEDYYKLTREPVYKGIKPRIIIEQYIEQKDSEELRDYRFFCFNGEPKFISVDFDINNKKRTRRNLYDLQWNIMSQTLSYPKEKKIIVEKPKRLDEMIMLSREMSEGFEHARVDFYYIDDEILFGEVTFFHQSGMPIITPDQFDFDLGNLIDV